MNHYQTLGIPTDASPADITAAYKRQSQAGDSVLPRPDLNEAYEVLSDPVRRHQYDVLHSFTSLYVAPVSFADHSSTTSKRQLKNFAIPAVAVVLITLIAFSVYFTSTNATDPDEFVSVETTFRTVTPATNPPNNTAPRTVIVKIDPTPAVATPKPIPNTLTIHVTQMPIQYTTRPYTSPLVAYRQSESFTLGSQQDAVRNLMGNVYRSDGRIQLTKWYYGPSDNDSYVIFIGNFVRGWYSHGDLKVWMGYLDPAAPPVKLRSIDTSVLKAMGTPTALLPVAGADTTHQLWYFGNVDDVSYIEMQNYTVIGWQNKKDMKISLGNPTPDAPPIRVGSSEQDVIDAMGTPDCISGGTWTYGFMASNSRVMFDDHHKVTGWVNNGDLKVE